MGMKQVLWKLIARPVAAEKASIVDLSLVAAPGAAPPRADNRSVIGVLKNRAGVVVERGWRGARRPRHCV
jgi:hypothetical protein